MSSTVTHYKISAAVDISMILRFSFFVLNAY